MTDLSDNWITNNCEYYTTFTRKCIQLVLVQTDRPQCTETKHSCLIHQHTEDKSVSVRRKIPNKQTTNISQSLVQTLSP